MTHHLVTADNLRTEVVNVKAQDDAYINPMPNRVRLKKKLKSVQSKKRPAKNIRGPLTIIIFKRHLPHHHFPAILDVDAGGGMGCRTALEVVEEKGVVCHMWRTDGGNRLRDERHRNEIHLVFRIGPSVGTIFAEHKAHGVKLGKLAGRCFDYLLGDTFVFNNGLRNETEMALPENQQPIVRLGQSPDNSIPEAKLCIGAVLCHLVETI